MEVWLSIFTIIFEIKVNRFYNNTIESCNKNINFDDNK